MAVPTRIQAQHVIEHLTLKIFTCVTCQIYTNDILETACGHLICKHCLITCFTTLCPICSHEMNPTREPKTIIRIINNINVTCDTCSGTYSLGQIREHKRKHPCPCPRPLHNPRPINLPKEHITNYNELLDLECPICLTISNNLIETICGHLICSTCFKKWEHTKKCMFCKNNPLPTSKAATHNKAANNLTVKCPICSSLYTFKNHHEHTQFCSDNPTQDLANAIIHKREHISQNILLHRSSQIDFNRPLNATGDTLLMLACHNSQTSIALSILTQSNSLLNLNPNQTNNNLETSLHIACTNNLFSIALQILNHPIFKTHTLNHQNHEGNTPLHIALQSPHILEVTTLINQITTKLNIHQPNKQGKTPLMLACLHHPDLVTTNIHTINDTNINTSDTQDNTILFAALSSQRWDIATTLLNHPSININHRNTSFNSCFSITLNQIQEPTNLPLKSERPIQKANQIKSSIHHIISLILARTDLSPIILCKALYTSCFSNLPTIASSIILHPNFNPHHTYPNNTTPLYVVCSFNYPELAATLLLISDPNHIQSSDSILINTCRKGHINCVKILLQYPDININYESPFNDTALTVAISYKYTQIAALLISDERIDINKEDGQGFTPLELAIRYELPEITRQILNIDTLDLTHLDPWGFTSLEAVKLKEGIFPGIVDLIESKIMAVN